MPKQRYKVTTMRKVMNEQLVNPKTCSPFLRVWMDTKTPDSMLEDAIVELKMGNAETALRYIGVALAICRDGGA